MAAKPKLAASPTEAPPTLPGVETEDLPITLVGLANVPAKGWVAVSCVIQGNRVVSRQLHCVPQRKEYAALALKQALYAKVLFPQVSILNTQNGDAP